MTCSESSTGPKMLQTLFLCTLFLYPFIGVDHTLYLIPQLLLVGIGLAQLPQFAAPTSSVMKVAVCGLAIVAGSIPIFRELLADQSEYLEPIKLSINLATVLLFLFLVPVFDPLVCAKWLKRFAIIWLLIVVYAYLHTDTSTWQLLLMLIGPEGITSAHLYEIAEPLAPIFLTKNIMAMYVVAIFGVFLYFRQRAGERVTLIDKSLFFLLIVALFSRQGILSGILLVAINSLVMRRGPSVRRWAVIVMIVTVLIVGIFFAFAFNLNSQEDGATTRLELWRLFFSNWNRYVFEGLGVHQLNASLEHLSIDNYHMFFMNQIAAYGLIHCLAFNSLLLVISLWCAPRRIRWFLIAPYWLNVCFQTYGYEYGNLLLYCIAANSCNLLPSPTPRYQELVLKPLVKTA